MPVAFCVSSAGSASSSQRAWGERAQRTPTSPTRRIRAHTMVASAQIVGVSSSAWPWHVCRTRFAPPGVGVAARATCMQKTPATAPPAPVRGLRVSAVRPPGGASSWKRTVHDLGGDQEPLRDRRLELSVSLQEDEVAKAWGRARPGRCGWRRSSGQRCSKGELLSGAHFVPRERSTA